LTVRYRVAGTTANGVDYAPLSGAVTLPAGEVSALVNVQPIDDALPETGETVILTLAPSSAYRIGEPATASVVLADSELDPLRPAVPLVSVSATRPSAGEPADDGTFTITRTGPTDAPLTAELSFSGSARLDMDFGSPLFVTLDSGVSRLALPFDILDDFQIEGPETVTLAVEPPAGTLAGPYLPAATIADDEPGTGLDGFYPQTPCRLADTRWPAGPKARPASTPEPSGCFPREASAASPRRPPPARPGLPRQPSTSAPASSAATTPSSRWPACPAPWRSTAAFRASVWMW